MTAETNAPGYATAITTVRVRRGREGALAGWLTRLDEAFASFPGCISAVMIPPARPLQSERMMGHGVVCMGGINVARGVG